MSKKPVYLREVPIYLEWVNEGVQDRWEGRGGLTQVDREIQSLAADYPELAPFRNKCSSERRRYERLADLGDPLKRGFRSSNEIWNEIISIEGTRILEKGGEVNRLIALSLSLPTPTDVSEHLVATWLAFKHYKESAVAGLDGLVLAYRWIGSLAGKRAVEIGGPRADQVIRSISYMQYEVLRGYTKGTVEDKNLMQELAALTYALAHEEISRDEAVALVSATVDTIMWAFISTQIDGAWSSMDQEATEKFTTLWTLTFGKAAKFMRTLRTPVKSEVYAQKLPGEADYQYPFCFYTADKESWISGYDSLELKPYRDFPYQVEQEESAISLAFGPMGTGKTVILKAISSKAVWDGHFVIILKSDKRNQPFFFCVPSVNLGSEIDDMLADMKVKPHPLPIMRVNFLREGQEHLLKTKPITIFDRVVYIRNPLDFELDFGILIDELKHIRDTFPFPSANRPKGAILAVTYLNRQAGAGQADEDLKIAAALNEKELRWREDNPKQPLLQLWDEITEVAPLEIKGGQSGQDLSRVTGQLYQSLLASRGLGMAIVGATVELKGVAPAILGNANNILFKDLPTEQMNLLLDKKSGIIQLDQAGEREIVMRLNEVNAQRGTRLWFLYRRPDRSIRLCMPCPPPTGLERKGISKIEACKRAEKVMGEKLLVDYNKVNWGSLSEGGITIARCGTGRQLKLPSRKELAVDISALERQL